MRACLTVAGFDPSCGAGIAADLRAFSATGVYGYAVVACLTVQDTRGVYRVVPVDADVLAEQLDVALSDSGVAWAKTGALGSERNARVAAEALSSLNVVVDPVLRSSSGAVLNSVEGVKLLLREARVATPNAYEASALSGLRVRSVDDAIRAAELLMEEYGLDMVVVKGGHLEQPCDIAIIEGKVYTYSFKRSYLQLHGLGCTYSALLTGFLARGMDYRRAWLASSIMLHGSLVDRVKRVGRGRLVVDLGGTGLDSMILRSLASVRAALDLVLENQSIVHRVVPEVGLNVAEAPLLAESEEEVVAVEGRIRRGVDGRLVAGVPWIGASSHVARIALSAMRIDPRVRAACSLRYDERLVSAFRREGLKVVFVDRSKEPRGEARVEGRSMQWIIREAVRLCGGEVPDVIYDKGDWGKEPIVRVLGESALDAVWKAIRAAKAAYPGS